MSIREAILAWLFSYMTTQLPTYDVRRVRIRPVVKGDRPSVSLVMSSERAVDETMHGPSEVTGTIDVVMAAMTDNGDAELDPVVRAVHQAVMTDLTCGGHAEALTYTGCNWTYDEGGDGLAVVATLSFDVVYRHALANMAAVPP